MMATPGSNGQVNIEGSSFEILNKTTTMHPSSAPDPTRHHRSSSPPAPLTESSEQHRVKPKSAPTPTESPVVTKATTRGTTRSPRRTVSRQKHSKSPRKSRKTSEAAAAAVAGSHSPWRESSAPSTKSSILLPPSTPATEVESVLSTPAGNKSSVYDDTITPSPAAADEVVIMRDDRRAEEGTSPPATPLTPTTDEMGERQQQQEKEASSSPRSTPSKKSKKSRKSSSKSSKSNRKSSSKKGSKRKQRRRSTRELEKLKYAKDQLEDSIRSGASQSLVDMMKDDGQAVVGNLMQLVASTGDPELAKSFERPAFRQSFLRWLSEDRDLGGDSEMTGVGGRSTILVDGADHHRHHQKQQRNKSSSSSKKERKAAAKKYQPSLANPNAAFASSVGARSPGGTNATTTAPSTTASSKGKQSTGPSSRKSAKPTAKREDSTSSGITETTPVTDNLNHGTNKEMSPALSEATKRMSNRIKDRRASDDEGEPLESEQHRQHLRPRPETEHNKSPRNNLQSASPKAASGSSMPSANDAYDAGVSPNAQVQQGPPSPQIPPPPVASSVPVVYEDSEALSFAIHCFLAQQAKALAMAGVTNPDQLEPSFHTATSSRISMSESTFSSGALSQAIEQHLQSKVQKAGLNHSPVAEKPFSAAPDGAGAATDPSTPAPARDARVQVEYRAPTLGEATAPMQQRKQQPVDDATEQSSLHPVTGGLMSIPSAPSESVVRKAVGLDDPTEASGVLTSAGDHSLPATDSVDLRQPPPQPAVPPLQKISIPSPSSEREMNQLAAELAAAPFPAVSNMVDPPSIVPHETDGYNVTSMPPPPGETPQDYMRPTLREMARMYEQHQAMLVAGVAPYPPEDDPSRHQQPQQPDAVPVHIDPLHHEEASVQSDITGLTGMDSRAATSFPRGRGMEVAVNPGFRMRKSYSTRHMTEEEKAIVRSPYASVATASDGLSGASSAKSEFLRQATKGQVSSAIRSPFPRDYPADYYHDNDDDDNDDSSSASSDSDDTDGYGSDEESDDEFGKQDVMVIAGNSEFPGGKPLTRLPRYALRSTQSAPPTSTRMAEYVRNRQDRHDLRVRFGNVTVREYERILGDNPSCTSGPALGIGWRCCGEREMELTDFAPRQRYGAIDHALILDRKEREYMLMDLGYTKKEIAQSVRALTKSRNQRRQTVGNLRNERIEYAMEKAKSRLIRILTVKKHSSVGGTTSPPAAPSASSSSSGKQPFQQHFHHQSMNSNSSVRSLPPF